MSIVLVTGGLDHKLRFWEAASGVNSKTVRFPGESQINCVAISTDKQLIVAGGNPQINLYDVNSSADAPLMSFDGHTSNVTAVGFHKDSKWIYSCSVCESVLLRYLAISVTPCEQEDGSVRIWDPRTPHCQRSTDVSAGGPAINTVVLHPNQTDLIYGDQTGCVRIWDLETGSARERHLPVPDTPIRSISIVCPPFLSPHRHEMYYESHRRSFFPIG
jgi:G protein beta subunit-like protein